MPDLVDQFSRPLNFSVTDPTRRSFHNTHAFSYRSQSDSELLPDKSRHRIIGYIREQAKCNPILAAILRSFNDNVGTPLFKATTSDQDYNLEKELFMERKFKRLCKRYNFHTLMQILNFEICVTGEAFVLFDKFGYVELIPSELVGSEDDCSELEAQGVIFTENGFISGYRVGKRLKNGQISYKEEDSQVIPAQFIKHYRRLTRAEQIRGDIPLQPCIENLQDLLEISRSKTKSLKLNSAFSLVVTKNDNVAEYAQLIATASSQGTDVNPYLQAGFARTDYSNQLIQDVTKGSIIYLEQGEDIKPISTLFESADYTTFELNLIKKVAAPLSIPIGEILNYEDSSYSSARADKLKLKTMVENVRKDLVESILDPMQLWLVNRASAFGEFLNAPNNEDGEVQWNYPVLASIDPQKEVECAVKRLDAGLTSQSQEISAMGGYGDTVLQERIQYAAKKAQLIKEESARTGLSEEEISKYL